ncbi:hypothetical protein D3C84_918310 [compost metagenome]
MRGNNASHTASIACSNFGPIKATTIIANSNEGIESRVSRIWFNTAERRPRVTPANTPRITPKNEAAKVTSNAEPKVAALPVNRRLRISRPKSSVPRKNDTLP